MTGRNPERRSVISTRRPRGRDAVTPTTSEAEPSAEFGLACREAGVEEADLALLWQLHQRWVRASRDERERRDQLLADYRHWIQYRDGRAGDERAAAAFEIHWRSYIRSFASRGFTPEQTDEHVAIFFERVYRLIGASFAWSCPFHVYLRQIVINIARDHARRLGERRRREVAIEETEVSQPLIALDRSPEEELLAQEVNTAVRRAVLALEPGDRHIVRVCMLEGGSGQELAATLGITRDALYQRLRRAKERLRATLDEFGQIRGRERSIPKSEAQASGAGRRARGKGRGSR